MNVNIFYKYIINTQIVYCYALNCPVVVIVMKKHLTSSIVTEDQAIEILNNGGNIGLPTETVYGLAGRIDSDLALQNIFSLKKRPFFDPLIVHISEGFDLSLLCENSNQAIVQELIKSYWPGPLTIILNKKKLISDLITSGLNTVALRCPKHKLAQKIIKNTGPLAAPSANLFGKTSPTNAVHVIESFSDALAVVDGGDCENGIESTIISFDFENKKINILRPGHINFLNLTESLKNFNDWKVEFLKSKIAPGHLENHYQPNKKLILVTDLSKVEGLIKRLKKMKLRWYKVNVEGSPEIFARKLYSQMRKLSKISDIDIIVYNFFIDTNLESWQGILDRLKKASSEIY